MYWTVVTQTTWDTHKQRQQEERWVTQKWVYKEQSNQAGTTTGFTAMRGCTGCNWCNSGPLGSQERLAVTKPAKSSRWVSQQRRLIQALLRPARHQTPSLESTWTHDAWACEMGIKPSESIKAVAMLRGLSDTFILYDCMRSFSQFWEDICWIDTVYSSVFVPHFPWEKRSSTAHDGLMNSPVFHMRSAHSVCWINQYY